MYYQAHTVSIIILSYRLIRIIMGSEYIFPFYDVSNSDLPSIYNNIDVDLVINPAANELTLNPCLDLNAFSVNSLMTEDSTDCDSDNMTFNVDLKQSDYFSVKEFNSKFSSSNKFLLIQINCRSLPKNFCNLQLLVSSLEKKPDVIVLSETWIHENLTALYTIPEYNFISISRKNKRGGGVGFYLSSKYAYTVRDDIVAMSDKSCEFLPIEITLSNKSIIIISIYRPPNADVSMFTSKVSEILSIPSLNKKNKKIILSGDCNIDLLKFNEHPKTNDFLSTIISHGFLPSVTRDLCDP